MEGMKGMKGIKQAETGILATVHGGAWLRRALREADGPGCLGRAEECRSNPSPSSLFNFPRDPP
jgi:hypothetical protein